LQGIQIVSQAASPAEVDLSFPLPIRIELILPPDPFPFRSPVFP